MKILPTIGPATEKVKDLKFLFNYCSMVRLNTSHNNIYWHKKIIKLIKKISNKVDILVDIPGVKPRTKNKKDINVKKNDVIEFGYKLKKINKNSVELTRKLPLKKNILAVWDSFPYYALTGSCPKLFYFYKQTCLLHRL